MIRGSEQRLPLSCRLLLALMVATALAAQPPQKPQQPTQVYLTEEEALEEAFPKAVLIQIDTLRLSPAQRENGRRQISAELDSIYLIHRAYDRQGAFMGYGLILDEVGKYEPITFITAVSPQLKVSKVAIMVYRESRGGEIRLPRFLYQYKGKSAKDPLQTQRDIINISGATLSVAAVNRGVRKALFVLNSRYAQNPPPLKLQAGHD